MIVNNQKQLSEVIVLTNRFDTLMMMIMMIMMAGYKIAFGRGERDMKVFSLVDNQMLLDSMTFKHAFC